MTLQAQEFQEFESQRVKDELTQAEAEELAVRKRRSEGTPCNKENFFAWKEKFDKEMEEIQEKQEEEAALKDKSNKKSKKKSEEEEMEGRLTGYDQFSQKLGLVNLDALEKAAEVAAEEEILDVDELDVDEDLFDEDDDLDDLDFDSDDDFSDDEEIDI